jgi:hypothetical protein
MAAHSVAVAVDLVGAAYLRLRYENDDVGTVSSKPVTAPSAEHPARRRWGTRCASRHPRAGARAPGTRAAPRRSVRAPSGSALASPRRTAKYRALGSMRRFSCAKPTAAAIASVPAWRWPASRPQGAGASLGGGIAYGPGLGYSSSPRSSTFCASAAITVGSLSVVTSPSSRPSATSRSSRRMILPLRVLGSS